MNEIIENGLILRFIERILLIAVCLVIVVQGVKLLITTTNGNTNIEYEGIAGKFKVTNAATGLVLVFLSSIIICYLVINKFEASGTVSNESMSGDSSRVSLNNEEISKIKNFLIKIEDSSTSNLSKPKPSSSPEETTNNKSPTSRTKASNNKNSQSVNVKYSDGSTGNYNGGLIRISTLKKLFYKLKFFKDNPNKIDRNDYSDLLDIYQEIYEFNNKNKLVPQDLSHTNLRR